MFGVLGLGLLLGMQHALEADHIAAVSSIAARRNGIGDIVKHGLTWGMGHTLTLFAFAGAAILLGHAIPEHVTRPLEAAVGIMLVDSVSTSYGDCGATAFIFSHSHSGVKPYYAIATWRHNASHLERARSRAWLSVAFACGRTMHGMVTGRASGAGISQVQAPSGLIYILLFGVGSMLGMGMLSAIAVPLVYLRTP